MKRIVIEKETLAVVLGKAVANGQLVKCDRCGVLVLADEMFGAVCNDCAMDLVEDGLEREEEALESEEELEALATAMSIRDIYERLSSFGVPIDAIDFDHFL